MTTQALRRTTLDPLRLVAAVLAGLLIVEAIVYVQVAIASPYFEPGMDYRFYMDAASRWLATGVWYFPYQLSGPYEVGLMVDILYPPTALALFVPFVFLPAVLWWAVPFGVIGYALYRWRPSPAGWVAVVLLLMWPGSLSVLTYGNTNLWIAAGVAGGLLWGWPAALLVLKPTLAPLALIGIRHRSWWVSMAVLGVTAALTIPAWRDYALVSLNTRGLDSVSYILWGLPIVVLPLVAFTFRADRRRGAEGPDPTVG